MPDPHDAMGPLCMAPHPLAPQITCGRPTRHDGDHIGRAYWSPAGDEAPTLKLPPVRDSIGSRRQPPALPTLPPGSVELLRLIVDALAADENGPAL